MVCLAGSLILMTYSMQMCAHGQQKYGLSAIRHVHLRGLLSQSSAARAAVILGSKPLPWCAHR